MYIYMYMYTKPYKMGGHLFLDANFLSLFCRDRMARVFWQRHGIHPVCVN